MPPIDRILSQYSNPIRSWPGEEDLDAEARANYEAANPPRLQTEGGAIDKGDLLPIVRYPEAKKSPSEWQSSSDVMRQLDDGWRVEPFSRLTAPFKSMAQAWREQPLLGPMVRPSQMNPEAFNQMTGDAMTVAGTGMTGGIGRAAAGHALPAGTAELGIFGGRKARTADLDALGRAEEMLKAGAPRDQVWKDTGWFQGVDGQWKFELDDSGSAYVESEMKPKVYNIAGNKVVGAEGEAGKVLAHPILDAAYPDMTGMKVARTNYRDHRLGQYDDAKGPFGGEEYIGLNMGAPMFEGRDTLLHELQHAVQAREGFAKGASPAQFAADGVPNPAFDVYQKARISDPELIELIKLYESGAHERALAAVNENWRKNFEPRIDALDQLPYTRATYATEVKPLYDRLFAESEASNRAISPDYARHDDLWKSLRSRGIPPKEPPRLLKPEDAYRATAGEVEARAVQARKNLTAEQRRERAPWQDFDVAEPQQIVRMDSRGEKGMFAGEKARTADREQLARAKEMTAAGVPREDIWSQTGWFSGPDGKWRFEIDDSGTKALDPFNEPGLLDIHQRADLKTKGNTNPMALHLDDIMPHEEFYKAYGYDQSPAVGFDALKGRTRGGYDTRQDYITLDNSYVLEPDFGRSTLLHELQHAAQQREGFARGASPSEFKPEAFRKEAFENYSQQIAEVMERDLESAEAFRAYNRFAAQNNGKPWDDSIIDQSIALEDRLLATRHGRELAELDWKRKESQIAPDESYTGAAYKKYRAHAGETEARAVQARQDLTPEQRRARAPWLDYDVPEKDQIVRVGNGEGAMSNKPLDMSPEARLARAREMGFDTGTTWYHGTKEQVGGFDLRKAGKSDPGLVGRAVYLTPSREQASDFAMSPHYGRGNTPNVMPLYARMRNPAVVVDGVLPDGRTLTDVHPRGITKESSEALKRELVRAGHDGVIFRTADGELMQAAVFEPSAVRSANADFDPNLSSSPTLMASIDPLTAAVSPPRQVDPLGYYSPTLDAALRLSQKKGTPEQMLAQLKKAGAKDSEIEVSGLKKMFEGKKSVSQEEIVKALEEGRLGLNEVRYGGSDAENRIEIVGRPWDDGEGVQAQTIHLNDKEYTAYYDPDAGNAWAVTPDGQTIPGTGRMNNQDWGNAHEAIQAHGSRSGIPDDAAGAARYADYSLDPENPTYREVVLHLPATKNTLEQWKIRDEFGNVRATYSDEASARAQARQGQTVERAEPVTLDGGFRSGHFGEPNIVGHMMVSETRLPGSNARVLTLDQVQSDWGQKLRDGGVRDEAKVAALDAKWRDGFAALEAHRAQGMPLRDAIASRHGLDPGNSNADGWLAARGREMELPAETLQEINAYFAQRNRLMNDHRLAEAELSTAKAASPGHPLVNTTDQWLNTTLRRAIRMASEEGQDYIAIPSGHTVLSYNPGQEGGMLGFYGGTPQEMSYLVGTLRDVAKATPDAKVIDALDPKSIDALAKAGILDKKKIEGISAARVLKNAEARFQGIVPKNLYALLQKLDKATPPPQVIDTLDSPSGKTGLGEGFTLFKITPEAKKAAKESGQPLFRFGGRVN